VIRQAIVCLLAVTLCGLEPRRRRAETRRGAAAPQEKEKGRSQAGREADPRRIRAEDKVEPREKVRPKDDARRRRRRSKAVLERISKNIREFRGPAPQEDAGGGTQQVQRDIARTWIH